MVTYPSRTLCVAQHFDFDLILGHDAFGHRDALPPGASPALGRSPRRQLTPRYPSPVQWLTDNGAVLSKLEWPAAVGDGGVRGVRATEAIAPFEEMLRVPRRLLISEERCWQDAQLGPVFADNRDVFSRDDPVLALFLVRELARGDRSFFHPYLAILPEPESVQDWTDDERAELCDRYTPLLQPCAVC
jgi:hypothetical protein